MAITTRTPGSDEELALGRSPSGDRHDRTARQLGPRPRSGTPRLSPGAAARSATDVQTHRRLQCAGLFDASGRLLCVREEVRRRNALDKVVGWASRNALLPLDDKIL